MIQRLVEVQRLGCAGLGRGQAEHLAGQAVNAGEFAAHQLGHLVVVAFFQQYLGVSLHGHETILDFMREAGGNEADVGEPVESPETFRHIMPGCGSTRRRTAGRFFGFG